MLTISKDKTLWVLLIFSTIYILGNISSGSLTTWDEALYANVSYNLLRTGDWLVLHDIPGKPWFDKPPLYMWCTAICYKIFGINEFSVRLTSALFGVASIMLVYIFTAKLSNKNAAILAALVLLALPQYLHFAKLGMMDVMLSFFVTLMVYFFWVGQEKARFLFFSGLVFGLAYLTKGFAAVLGPIIVFSYSILSGRLRSLLKKEFVLGIIVSLLAIFAWHITQYLSVGPEAVNNYFGFHIFQRATTSLEGHAGGLNFYQKVIFNKNKPWGILLYPSFVYTAWTALRHKDKRAILLSVWALSAYILYATVKTKLHWYIIPIYPALAISSGLFLDRFFKDRAFKLCLGIILTGMLLQVPLSWAFKLDLNPEVKYAALHSKKLSIEDNGTIFYYSTVKGL